VQFSMVDVRVVVPLFYWWRSRPGHDVAEGVNGKEIRLSSKNPRTWRSDSSGHGGNSGCFSSPIPGWAVKSKIRRGCRSHAGGVVATLVEVVALNALSVSRWVRGGQPDWPWVIRVGEFPESRLPVERASYESEHSRGCLVCIRAWLGSVYCWYKLSATKIRRILQVHRVYHCSILPRVNQVSLFIFYHRKARVKESDNSPSCIY
jgi:hypothetical protein